MRRIVSLLAVLLFTIPVGVSLSGCSRSTPVQYCQGSTGIRVGQVTTLTLQPQFYGKSLAYGQTDTMQLPSAADCKGDSVSLNKYTFASSNQALVDIDPSTGDLCAGTWNRNTPGGTPDYTFCTPGNLTGTAQVVATGGGATSNKITVYVHAPIALITLGSPTAAANCSTTSDPSSNCCPLSNTPITAAPYDQVSCVSQKDTRQIVLRAYDSNNQNITCQVGHPSFTPVTNGIVTIDENGVATAQLPGSTTLTATISRFTSTTGLFATCPPASITINTPNAVGGNVAVTPNTTEPITATVFDNNVTSAFPSGHPITGLNLTYTSTTPTTVGVSATGILATFPSSSAINAFCQPPTCNPSPLDTNFGIFGTGKPVASNTIEASAAGLNGTLLWIASTSSQYIAPVDFTTNNVGAPVRLPYVPNSMVISQDGGSIYLGSDTELMTYSAQTNGISKEDNSIKGRVLAAAPDSTSIVLTDPTQTKIVIYNPASGGTIASHLGVATYARYAPDSQTIYIATTDNHLLVYSANTNWHDYGPTTGGGHDVTVTVPAVGAYTAGVAQIIGHSYCANTTVAPVDYYPVAGSVAAISDRVAATNDARHILGLNSSAGGVPTLNDVNVTLPVGSCPPGGTATFTNATFPTVLTGVNAGACTIPATATAPFPVCGNVVPASDSSLAFVTYPAATTAPTTGTLLPAYRPTTTGPGTLSFVTLADGATAPAAGVFATDNSIFYVGTAGDNLVHLVSRATLTDTRQINPKLPVFSGSGFATPNLLVQKPRPTT
jgi:hypothetical protein